MTTATSWCLPPAFAAPSDHPTLSIMGAKSEPLLTPIFLFHPSAPYSRISTWLLPLLGVKTLNPTFIR